MSPEQEAAVLEILDGANDMTVATVRPDGYPQATTVSFVHDDCTLHFATAHDSQKAHNIARAPAVSLTVNLPYDSLATIRGISLGGRAGAVTDPDEIHDVFARLLEKYPALSDLPPEARAELGIIRIDPEVISLIDYRKGFGHTEEIQF